MTELAHSFAATWWGWVAPVAVQFAVLFALVAALDRVLPRRTWPQLRLAMWTLAMVKLALPPWVASPWSALPALAADRFAFVAGDGPAPAWALVVPVVWLAVAAGVAIAGFARARRCRRHWDRGEVTPTAEIVAAYAAAAALAGARRAPRLVVTTTAPGPLFAGIWRPAVYLPDRLAASSSRGELEHVLVHELAHWQRRDAWWCLALTLIQVAFWFHPLVWIAGARIAVVREHCCDRTVVARLGGAGDGYRKSLLAAAARVAFADAPALPLLLPRASLRLRLDLIADAAGERAWLRRAAMVALLGGVAVVGVPVASAAEGAAHALADRIERPPGCLPLRFLVLERMAKERSR